MFNVFETYILQVIARIRADSAEEIAKGDRDVSYKYNTAISPDAMSKVRPYFYTSVARVWFSYLVITGLVVIITCP